MRSPGEPTEPSLLKKVARGKGLPPKLLVAHQFTLNTLPDKENMGRSPLVDPVPSVVIYQ